MKQIRLHPSRTAVTMAVYIASTTTSVGFARGFHLSKPFFGGLGTIKNDDLELKSSSLRSLSLVGAPAKLSTCHPFLQLRGGAPPPSESPSSKKFSALASDTEDSIDNSKEIENAASTCMRSPTCGLSITGTIPPPLDFGGITYLDTTSLTENNAHRVIFILGGPGAGKGTQSERIVDTYKCVHLSVGELLRSGAENENYPHADMVKECLVQGKIVPVELSLGLLRTAMDEKAAEEGSYGSRIFLVDGFPRNYDNVQGWMEHMPTYTSVLGALVYNCPMEILEQRILSRAETSGRSDDNLTSARRRFDTFRRETEPVVRALEMAQAMQSTENEGNGGQILIVNIDGTGSIEEVWDTTENAMNSYIKNDILTANSNLLKAIEDGDIKAFNKLCADNLSIEIIKGDIRERYNSISARDLFEKHETKMTSNVASISNASIQILDGVKAFVSYENGGSRERREWHHGPKGWKCVSLSKEKLP